MSSAKEQLKIACQEYYSSQQSLRRAEEEQIHLETSLRRVTTDLGSREESLRSCQLNLLTLLQQAEAQRYIPAASPDQAMRYLQEEKKLHTTIAVHEGALQETCQKFLSLKKQLENESKTVKVLDQSLSAQAKVNEDTMRSVREAVAELHRLDQRGAEIATEKEGLSEELRVVKREQVRLSSSLRSRTVAKTRAQDALHNWDMDTLRARKDTAFAHRMYLNEVEHGRSQELFLQQLLAENRRLRLIAASRLGTTVISDGSHVDPSTLVEGREPLPRKEQAVLEGVRKQNMQLLQQVVSSLGVLQQMQKEQ